MTFNFLFYLGESGIMAKKIILILIVFTAIIIIAKLPQRISDGYWENKYTNLNKTRSLQPELERIVGVRFDPSYYYNTNKTPKKIAMETAESLHRKKINHVFFRVYDPEYGAFYKTKYKYESRKCRESKFS